jgi:cytoskeletal protein CcmA (bactofilin family)
LTISGSDNNNGLVFETGSGSTLNLAGGTVTTQTVQIDPGGFFTGYGTINGNLVSEGTNSLTSVAGTVNITGPLTVNGSVENDGALTVSGNTNLTINVPVDDSGAFVNNGTMTIDGGSTLVVNMPGDGSGSFINNGLLDIMDSPQSALPAGYVNNGTILTSALVTVNQFTKSGGTFTVSIQSYTRHTYQLQKSTDLKTWQNVGIAQAGTTGFTLTFSDTNASAAGTFYQIAVGP